MLLNVVYIKDTKRGKKIGNHTLLATNIAEEKTFDTKTRATDAALAAVKMRK